MQQWCWLPDLFGDDKVGGKIYGADLQTYISPRMYKRLATKINKMPEL
jgi:hypothetical protein